MAEFIFTYSVEGYVDITVSAKTEEAAERIANDLSSEVDCGELYGVDWQRVFVQKDEDGSFIFTYSVEGYADITASAETEDAAEKVADEQSSEVDCGELYGIDWQRVCVNEIADD